MERRCWVNFHCRGVLIIWLIVGQGPIALAIGAGGGCLEIFFCHGSRSHYTEVSLATIAIAIQNAKHISDSTIQSPIMPNGIIVKLHEYAQAVMDQCEQLMIIAFIYLQHIIFGMI